MVYTYGGMTWVPLTSEKGYPRAWLIHEQVTGDGTTFDATFPNTAAKGVEVASYLQGHRIRIKSITLSTQTEAFPIQVTWAIYPDATQAFYLVGGMEIIPTSSPTWASSVAIPVDLEIPFWHADRNWVGCLFEMWTKPPSTSAQAFTVEIHVEVLD